MREFAGALRMMRRCIDGIDAGALVGQPLIDGLLDRAKDVPAETG